jgi:hypothetical protein
MDKPDGGASAKSALRGECPARLRKLWGAVLPIRPAALFVIEVFLSLGCLEPVLVLLAVGHGGSFKGLNLF